MNKRLQLRGFIANDYIYRHFIDTSTDMTFITDGDGKDIFTVDSGATVRNGDGNIIGRFRFSFQDRDTWTFINENDQTLIETGEHHLLKAEVEVFKTLLQ